MRELGELHKQLWRGSIYGLKHDPAASEYMLYAIGRNGDDLNKLLQELRVCIECEVQHVYLNNVYLSYNRAKWLAPMDSFNKLSHSDIYSIIQKWDAPKEYHVLS